MGDGVVRVDPEKLARVSADLATIADTLGEQLGQLDTALSASGNPWGGDETGTIFSALYMKILSHAMDSLSSYVEQVGYAAAGLHRHARAHADHDAAAAAHLQQAGSAPGATR